MSTVRKTITLTAQQDKWVKQQVDAGGYTNDREYIRDLIRREQERGTEIDAIRAALVEGAQTGEPRPCDALAFNQRMRAKQGERKP